MKLNYIYGLKKGIPIALGYLSVSFGFGISAIALKLSAIQAILISLTNLTSAGQVAGIGIIASMGSIIEMIIAQFIINIRYSLMGIALTQKLEDGFSFFHRIVSSFGITDEIFVMAASEKEKITPSYMYGLMTLPIIGWTLGTTLGAYSGEILPAGICAALGLAIYTMFVAIIIPPARDNSSVALVILISAILSCILYYTPVLKANIPSGFSIIICAVTASAFMAWLKPVEETLESTEGGRENE